MPDHGGTSTIAIFENFSDFQIGTSGGGNAIDAPGNSVSLIADNTFGAGMGVNTATISQINEPAGKILAGSLQVTTGFVGYTLDNPQNQVGTLSSYTEGSAVFYNATDLNIGRVQGSPYDNGTIQANDVSISAAGNITLSGDINAKKNTKVRLDATGSITVNANIFTDDANASSGAGTIILTANDPNLLNGAGTSGTNGIFGNGTLTSGNIYLNVGEGPEGLSGGVGTAGQFLTLDTVNPDFSPIALRVTTFGGDVYLRALNNVVLAQGMEDGPPQASVDLRPDTGLSPAPSPAASLWPASGTSSRITASR